MTKQEKSLSVEERREIRRRRNEATKQRKAARLEERKRRYVVFYGDATDEDRELVDDYLKQRSDCVVLRRPRLEEKDCVHAAGSASISNATLIIPRLACASRRCLDIFRMLEETGDFIHVCDMPGASVCILQIQAALTEYQDDFRLPRSTSLPDGLAFLEG